MRRLKRKEIANGQKWCSSCLLTKDEKVLAVWKSGRWLYCDECKENQEPERELTEADYQTWMRL